MTNTIRDQIEMIAELGDLGQLEDLMIENGICNTKEMPYEQYLRTPQWKTIRRLKLEASDYKCSVCGGTDRLEVHHNTYDRRGCERLADLAVLCRRHHRMIEGLKAVFIMQG